MVLGDPARRLTFGLAVSNTKLTATFVVATLLHTRVPTGKNRGPEVGLLLSSPTMFQETGAGAMLSVVAAFADSDRSSAARTDRGRPEIFCMQGPH